MAKYKRVTEHVLVMSGFFTPDVAVYSLKETTYVRELWGYMLEQFYQMKSCTPEEFELSIKQFENACLYSPMKAAIFIISFLDKYHAGK